VLGVGVGGPHVAVYEAALEEAEFHARGVLLGF